MGRTLDQVIAELPPERLARVDARYRELKQEIESLRELREIADKAQLDVAAALRIRQPSAPKIEKQTDMYLSTLRSYVEAVGRKLELVVKLPKRPAIRLHQLGDTLGAPRSSEAGARSFASGMQRLAEPARIGDKHAHLAILDPTGRASRAGHGVT